MATKKFIELQEMSVESIHKELSQLQTDLNRMKFDHGSKGLQNPLELNESKKDIARLLTELRSREIKAMTSAEIAGRCKIRLRRK